MSTVIVTGAGASHPFGFPLGSELIDDIKKTLQSANVAQWGQSVGFSLDLINDFKEVLAGTRHATIDQFLEAKKEFRQIGGCLIAQIIYFREKHAQLFPVRDWHTPLDHVLFRNYMEGTKSTDLTFVTLNYDRSLEYLFSKLHRYDCHHAHESQYCSYLSEIPIVHAHGSLGTLEELEYGLQDGRSIDWQKVKQAGSRIQIISDTLEKSPTFKLAQKVLEGAEKVICLGFAYHPSTLSTLFRNIDFSKTQFIGTAKDLAAYRLENVKHWSKNSADLHPKDACQLMNFVFNCIYTIQH